jgi:hypothetical protein
MVSVLHSFENRLRYASVASADRKSGPFEQSTANRWDKGDELTGRDLAEILDLLKRKLSWYGFSSIALGPVMKVREDIVSVDLMDRGLVVGRVEVECRSGTIKRWLPLHLLPD